MGIDLVSISCESRILLHLDSGAHMMLIGLLAQLHLDVSWLTDVESSPVPGQVAAAYGRSLTRNWQRVQITSVADDMEPGRRRRLFTVNVGEPLDLFPETLRWLVEFRDLCAKQDGFSVVVHR